MITEYREVVLVGGQLWNIGEWDVQERQVEVINNPFPGPMEAPDDWDYQITYRTEETNPLPEGATTSLEEVFLDRQGAYRLVSQAPELEEISRVTAAKAELADLMIKVQLSLATEAEKTRATELYQMLKSIEDTR